MKLGLHGATTMKADLATDIKVSAAAGFKGLELQYGKIQQYLTDHSLTDLRKLFEQYAIEPMSINTLEFIGFREDYSQVQNECRKLSQIAEAIGCTSIVTIPSPTPRSYKGQPELNYPWDELVNEYVGVLQDLSGIAGGYNVRLAFEFLGFGWCSVRTPRGAYEIVQKTARENVGMNFDTCHFYAGGGLLSEMDGVDASRIFTFHLNDLENVPKEAITDAVRVMPGWGVIPLGDVCGKLKQIGYDGSCTVELFRPEYWEWDPLETAKKSYETAVKVLSPYFTLE
jgi:2-keto-myo-inositol isomerase